MKATTIKASRKASAGVKHALLILLSFIAVFPLYWMIVSSFKNEAEIFGSALLPTARPLAIISTPFRACLSGGCLAIRLSCRS